MYDITKSRNTLGDVTADGITVGQGTAISPSVAFGDGDTGFFEPADDTLQVSIAGSAKWEFSSGLMGTSNSTRSGFVNESATATNPNIVPRQDDPDTGISSVAADQPCVVAGGVNAVTWIENGGVLALHQATSGITADIGSSQGDGPITSSFNEISVCANAGDAVTLPSAVAGYKVMIINNGAQACDVFPASSDNLGAGVNTAVSLAAGVNITYFAYDVTNWATLV